MKLKSAQSNSEFESNPTVRRIIFRRAGQIDLRQEGRRLGCLFILGQRSLVGGGNSRLRHSDIAVFAENQMMKFVVGNYTNDESGYIF